MKDRRLALAIYLLELSFSSLYTLPTTPAAFPILREQAGVCH